MTTFNGNRQFQSKPITNALVPREGPKMVPILIPFGDAGLLEFEIDLTLSVDQAKMTAVQGLYINNSNGGLNTDSVFSITDETTQQEIRIAPGSQAYLPILAGQHPKFRVTAQTANPVYIAFLNVPVPAIMWGVGDAGTVVDQGAPNTGQPWPVETWINGAAASAGNRLPVDVGVQLEPFTFGYLSDGLMTGQMIADGNLVIPYSMSFYNSGTTVAFIKIFIDGLFPPTFGPILSLAILPGSNADMVSPIGMLRFPGPCRMFCIEEMGNAGITPTPAGQVQGYLFFTF